MQCVIELDCYFNFFSGGHFTKSQTLPVRYIRDDGSTSSDDIVTADPVGPRPQSAASARGIIKELSKDAGFSEEDLEDLSKANLRRSTRHLKERIALQ